jgi:hypothetical protein
MLFTNKKPTVRFVNLVPGVKEAHPIAPAKEFIPAWMKKAAGAYKEQCKVLGEGVAINNGSIINCIGLRKLFHTGYVVPAPFDFKIMPSDDKISFKWNSPIDPASFSDYIHEEYISKHTEDQLAEFMPFREDTLKSLVKVQTFWRIRATEDIVFIQIPFPYSDHNNFSASHGIVDPYDTPEVNVQLFWHNTKETVFVPAGTPLCQLIPVPRDYLANLLVEDATPEDYRINQGWKYIILHRFRKTIKQWNDASHKFLRWKND